MSVKYKCLYEITGRIEDVATFLVPLKDLPKQEQVEWVCDKGEGQTSFTRSDAIPITLEQPKQEQGEPYAYEVQEGDSFTLVYSEAVHKYKMVSEDSIVATLYTTPQQRKPLTDEQAIIIKGSTCPAIDWNARHGVEMNNGERNEWLLSWFMAFKDAIEAAHGIKE